MITNGQAKTAGAKKAASLKTPWGDPDLQGIWTGSTITPLERPAKFAGKNVLSEAEAAELEKLGGANVVLVPCQPCLVHRAVARVAGTHA